jgi:mRNA interferase RelE/StbE
MRKLDPDVRSRIAAFIYDRLATDENPRRIGEALSGARFRGLWKYRVGDYRIVARIEDAQVLIVVIEVGHRREVYR